MLAHGGRGQGGAEHGRGAGSVRLRAGLRLGKDPRLGIVGGGRAEDPVPYCGIGILRSLSTWIFWWGWAWGQGVVSLLHLAHSPNQVRLEFCCEYVRSAAPTCVLGEGRGERRKGGGI